MKNIVTLLILALCASSCRQDKDSADKAASPLLQAARTELAQKNYQAARDSILQLRKNHPTAFQTRRAAILLMDSIELAESRDSLTLLDALVQTEREKLDTIKNQEGALKKDEYYEQKNKVYHMEQHLDELAAKVKFYIRKIDIDKNKTAPEK
ncbi:MAG: hypothetical protein NC388_07430 [Clostridium sp.]|nr:hypothetical protein [Clostridium sp.]